MTSADLVSPALLDPEASLRWDARRWDLLVRQARRANMLSRLAATLQRSELLDRVPAGAREHLRGAALVQCRQSQAVLWEAREISKALASLGVPLILLKGAAYQVAGLPPAMGRVFSDIDILVPKELLPQVEAVLMLHGWATTHHNEYDQHYYRRWMHELPPMRHVTRGTVVDVHHAILPETARLSPDPKKLREFAVPVDGSAFFVLAPTDMVLHSATHLFHDGELENGLRDLFDLNDLLTKFGREPRFWIALVDRALELGLERPLFYGLRYTRLLLGTEMPAAIVAKADVGKPSAPLLALMDTLFLRALRPDHPSLGDRWTPLARWMLYVRSHWLRMPPLLLAYHLTVKAFRKKDDEEG